MGGTNAYLHSFQTSALDGGEWSISRPGRFIHGKENKLSIEERALGGPQKQSGRYRKEINILHPLGLEPRIAQPVA